LPEQVQQLKGKMNASALLPLFEQNQESDLPDFEESPNVVDGQVGPVELGAINVEGQNKSFLQNLVEQATSQNQIGNALTSQQLLKMSPEEREKALALQAENLTSIAEQNKAIQNARTMFGQLGVNEKNNALVDFIRRGTGLSGDGGLESEEDILNGLSATMQADLRSLFPQIPKGIPITRSLVNRLIPIATAQKLDRDIKVFRSEVKGKLDITADFKDNRPIEPTDVKNMIGPHGQILTDSNMTYREARALGYVAVPESIRKKVGKITSATELLKQFRILIPKVFTNNGDDIIASGIRFKDGIVRRTQAALKTNPDIILYQALSESLVTLFRAPVGESGAPSNFDIERLKKAIPSPISTFAEPFVMNRKTALEQMEVMEEIFEADIKASTGGEINPTPSLQLQKAEKDFKSSVGGIPDN